MAHELETVLNFFKSFGDDNFRHTGNGSVHKMKDYAAIVKKFMEKEIKVAEDAAKQTAQNVVQATQEVKAVSNPTSPPSPAPVVPKPEAPPNVIREKGKESF